jgi:inorganic pyrophosphatase
MPEAFFEQLRHFFEQYKVLENKKVEIDRFQTKEDAIAVINDSIKLYQEKFKSN